MASWLGEPCSGLASHPGGEGGGGELEIFLLAAGNRNWR